jgi:hypothetical protein
MARVCAGLMLAFALAVVPVTAKDGGGGSGGGGDSGGSGGSGGSGSGNSGSGNSGSGNSGSGSSNSGSGSSNSGSSSGSSNNSNGRSGGGNDARGRGQHSGGKSQSEIYSRAQSRGDVVGMKYDGRSASYDIRVIDKRGRMVRLRINSRTGDIISSD